jgi:hypothetical protein
MSHAVIHAVFRAVFRAVFHLSGYVLSPLQMDDGSHSGIAPNLSHSF